MPKNTLRSRFGGFAALSPLPVMALLFLTFGLLFQNFKDIPLLIVFICTSVYSLFTLRGLSFEARLTEFSRGAGSPDLLLMIWIFILAGAFASAAKGMEAVDATVNLTLILLPPGLLLPGLFMAACFISLAIGTSVGTVVALTPIASGLAASTHLSLPLLVAAVVGGAFFGDNLSFISDTTVVATRTQGCRMKDKFITNFKIALPAAAVTFVIYMFMGYGTNPHISAEAISFWKVMPYLVVLITAILGLNVLIVLCIGIVLTGMVGIPGGSYDMAGWLKAICDGIGGMSELILISMMAGGLLSVIRRGGGITWLIHTLTRRVRTLRGAELSIAALVSLTNLCTANNTVAILSTGPLAREISRKFGVSPRRSASLLDTFSCCIQGIIPYGAQLLMAGGLAAVSPTAIIPYLFYPALLGISALSFIFIAGRKRTPTAAKAAK